MKEVTISEEQIEGELFLEHSIYKFTEEETESLKEELLHYPDDAVELFLSVLERNCEFMQWMLEAPGRQEHRETMDDMLKTFKNSLHYLKLIYETRIYIPYQREIDGLGSWLVRTDHIVGQIAAKASVKDAWTAREPLERLVKIIESFKEPKHKKGRPQDYTTKLAIATAQLFHHVFFEKPTTYEEGTYARIFRKLLEILGLPCEDPSRAINTGVKNYKYPFPEK